ncbi:MAG: hypothetical protein NTX03_09665 [Bacteroidetes bacterium]|nr:hypothetical protein [Bacteroidota bacterium]
MNKISVWCATNHGSEGTTLHNDSLISYTMVSYVQQIFDVIKNSWNSQNETYQSTTSFNTSITAIENDITTNHTIVYDANTFKGNEYATLLAACEIAKSSYSYWINVGANSNDAWHTNVDFNYGGHNNNGTGGGATCKIWRFIKRTAADVGGFFGDLSGGHFIVTGRDLMDNPTEWGYSVTLSEAWDSGSAESDCVE